MALSMGSVIPVVDISDSAEYDPFDDFLDDDEEDVDALVEDWRLPSSF